MLFIFINFNPFNFLPRLDTDLVYLVCTEFVIFKLTTEPEVEVANKNMICGEIYQSSNNAETVQVEML